MSVIQNNLLLAGDDAYNLTRSLRFRSSASASLTRTPSTETNRQTWTFSAWVKRGTITSAVDDLTILSAGNTSSNRSGFYFRQDDALQLFNFISASTSCSLITTQVFRDPSAWYHIVLAVDTTQATSTNRVKIYVNGTQITSFSTATYPAQNATFQINNNVVNAIGRKQSTTITGYYDGYIAEAYLIDGQALTPSSFGATNASTGVWQPKKYAGTYGTNGFYLPFTDNSGATSTTIGKDFSGNSNNWTPNNISVTAGSTYDSMTDVPTLTSATASNFCVLNPLNTNSPTYLKNGNLFIDAIGGTSYVVSNGTIGVSTGKWYFECTIGATYDSYYPAMGVTTIALNGSVAGGGTGDTGAGYFKNGQKLVSETFSSYGSSYTTGDVIGVALDLDSGTKTVTFYKNNVSQGAITVTGSTFWANMATQGTATITANFGQQPFVYTPPTGFVALNTFNLPTPTIGATATTQANKYFDALIWTGNGTTNTTFSQTGLGFAPDFVWAKKRSGGTSHLLYDVLRGPSTSSASKALSSDYTGAEGTQNDNTTNDYLSSFNSNGFSYYSGSSPAYFNTNGGTYVAWNWKANGTGSTNTAGSITSTVSANTSAGFSVVTYTGNGTGGATVGHGLGVAPRMLIIKARDGAGYSWKVYHGSLGSGSHLELESSGGSQGGIWNSTNPSSTVFTLGTNAGINENGKSYIAYVFAEVTGYSKISSFTGNGNADGTFVYTGFRPKYILTKSTSAARFWFVTDTSRDTYNVCNLPLFPNDSQGETAGTTDFDILSNGFKARTTNAAVNGNGETIIYMAFAENPFKYSLAR